ncbi:TolB family protein [Chloroflexota bacterium]
MPRIGERRVIFVSPPRIGRAALFLVAACVIMFQAGCGTESAVLPGPTATSTGFASPSATASPTALPTDTETATMTPTTTPSPTPTSTPIPSITPSPTPQPGASLIAFETNRDGNGEIYLLDTQSGSLVNLTRNAADDRAPAWRPDGGAIAFESHRSGNWDIYVLDLIDGSVSRLTDNPAYDGTPAWSPAGISPETIAFESYRDGNLDIYTVPPEGGEVARITDDAAGDYGPAWSPDGSSIAFTSWRDGNKEVYLVPVGGGAPRNVTQHPGDDEDPAWTADGLALVFTSWRDVDSGSGNRNAELFRLSLEPDDPSDAERVTDSPWPDLDPSWDTAGRLVWASYDPGPAFEAYDPFRPGDFHLYRTGPQGPERLTNSNWDDRAPAPAPANVVALAGLLDLLPAEPPLPTPNPELGEGELVEVVEVPGVMASYSGQPVRVNELVALSLASWQQELFAVSGWDFLGQTLGAWRGIDQVRKREMYAYDYGFLSWHKAGRAMDLALEYKVNNANQMLLAREDLGENVYWRIHLRTARQDGSQGEPLKDNPWIYWWHIVPESEPEAYAAGGKRASIPAGYYVDVTALAKRHGWERIAAYAIDGDYHWKSDSNGTEYWHYERTDGLLWWEAVSQLYDQDTLEQYVGWNAGLDRAQTQPMMRSKGVPEH